MIPELLILYFVHLSSTQGQLPLGLDQLSLKPLVNVALEPLEQLKIVERLPEEDMDGVKQIIDQGYPVESHDVITSDGNILTMFRIPRGRGQDVSSSTKKHPVLINVINGLANSADHWFLNLGKQNLAFILADSGYDVWAVNYRNTRYSPYETLPKTDKEFREFSLQDMSEKDLPSMIDYILNVTTSKQLSYVGFSQGALIAFAAFSQNTAIAEKVKTFIALAPVATLKSLFTVAAPLLGDLKVTPPEYDLSTMNVSTVAFWSPDDMLADAEDVALLLSKLPNVESYRVDGFSHMDFIRADGAAEKVYSKILATLNDKA